MGRYQLRSADGSVVAEESLESFDAASVWALEQDVEPGWTLFQHLDGQWTAAQSDPAAT